MKNSPPPRLSHTHKLKVRNVENKGTICHNSEAFCVVNSFLLATHRNHRHPVKLNYHSKRGNDPFMMWFRDIQIVIKRNYSIERTTVL